MSTIAGPAAEALKSLTKEQIQFIQALPKVELHAHLNGSIPVEVLSALAEEYQACQTSNGPRLSNDAVQKGLNVLLDSGGPSLERITDFFTLFPAIYTLTSTPASLARATRAVLSAFLDGEHPQCTYIELRTTPRETPDMTREAYVRIVLGEIARYGPNRAALIVSLDRRMGHDVLRECVDLVKKLKSEGERIVGVDLCGDPTAGEMSALRPYFEEVRRAGLGVTLHIAETTQNTSEETLELLSFLPSRLGHATFLDEEAKRIVEERKTPIEICLSSNLLCKTVSTLDIHHIRHYLKLNHPIAICTDDTLPFRTSLLGEYALLMAQPPLGLGLSEDEVKVIGRMSLDARFS